MTIEQEPIYSTPHTRRRERDVEVDVDVDVDVGMEIDHVMYHLDHVELN